MKRLQKIFEMDRWKRVNTSSSLAVVTVLMCLALSGCGDDVDTSELHAGECETDADCPVTGQVCVESRSQNRHYCSPPECDTDTDCTPEQICGQVPGGPAPVCLSLGAAADGLPCKEEDEDLMSCAINLNKDSTFAACQNAQWEEVGSCPTHLSGCMAHHGNSMIRCGEEDGLDFAVAGQTCYQEGIGACSPGQEATLGCNGEQWEVIEQCNTECRLLDDSEPGVDCGDFTSECIGCAP